MDANLSSLMGNTSPFKIQKKYFRQARKRLWKRFRKRGIQNLLGDFLSEVKISAAFATDRLR
jgi:hypothetical protein